MISKTKQVNNTFHFNRLPDVLGISFLPNYDIQIECKIGHHFSETT